MVVCASQRPRFTRETDVRAPQEQLDPDHSRQAVRQVHTLRASRELPIHGRSKRRESALNSDKAFLLPKGVLRGAGVSPLELAPTSDLWASGKRLTGFEVSIRIESRDVSVIRVVRVKPRLRFRIGAEVSTIPRVSRVRWYRWRGRRSCFGRCWCSGRGRSRRRRSCRRRCGCCRGWCGSGRWRGRRRGCRRRSKSRRALDCCRRGNGRCCRRCRRNSCG